MRAIRVQVGTLVMIQFVDVLGVTSVITAAPQIISALGGGTVRKTVCEGPA